jgi:hypothetical protein
MAGPLWITYYYNPPAERFDSPLHLGGRWLDLLKRFSNLSIRWYAEYYKKTASDKWA